VSLDDQEQNIGSSNKGENINAGFPACNDSLDLPGAKEESLIEGSSSAVSCSSEHASKNLQVPYGANEDSVPSLAGKGKTEGRGDEGHSEGHRRQAGRNRSAPSGVESDIEVVSAAKSQPFR